jgi:hypothetical protein
VQFEITSIFPQYSIYIFSNFPARVNYQRICFLSRVTPRKKTPKITSLTCSCCQINKFFNQLTDHRYFHNYTICASTSRQVFELNDSENKNFTCFLLHPLQMTLFHSLDFQSRCRQRDTIE